jgi:hypothetical protein
MKAFTEWLKQCYLEPFNSHGLEWDTLNGSLFVGQPAKEYSKIISELSDTLEKSASVHAATVFDGCFDGFNGGPYIVFESPKAEEVRKTVIAAEGNLKSEERSALYKKAMQYNTDDQRRLYRLLEDFYALHNTEYEQMLEVQTVGFSNFRLRYQGAESMLLDSVDARMRRLKTNCGDMKMLIEYLKK